ASPLGLPRVAPRRPLCQRRPMSPRPDLGPKPRLSFAASRIVRAAERRADGDALAALAREPRTRAYVASADLVVLRQGTTAATATPLEPTSTLAEARALGATAETIFLGFLAGEARFAVALAPATVEALKERGEFVLTDLRTIAVRGLVDADHLGPLAE